MSVLLSVGLVLIFAIAISTWIKKEDKSVDQKIRVAKSKSNGTLQFEMSKRVIKQMHDKWRDYVCEYSLDEYWGSDSHDEEAISNTQKQYISLALMASGKAYPNFNKRIYYFPGGVLCPHNFKDNCVFAKPKHKSALKIAYKTVWDALPRKYSDSTVDEWIEKFPESKKFDTKRFKIRSTAFQNIEQHNIVDDDNPDNLSLQMCLILLIKYKNDQLTGDPHFNESVNKWETSSCGEYCYKNIEILDKIAQDYNLPTREELGLMSGGGCSYYSLVDVCKEYLKVLLREHGACYVPQYSICIEPTQAMKEEVCGTLSEYEEQLETRQNWKETQEKWKDYWEKYHK